MIHSDLVFTGDGRATRWEGHNAERRREIVRATLKSIRLHGAGVGIDQIAADAGAAKTVIYRHFGGRTGLYSAVVESVRERIMASLRPVLAHPDELQPAQLVRGLAEAYLALVERDPEIYQFVTNRPLGEDPVKDPVTSITAEIGEAVSEAFRGWLRARGMDPRPANTWGHGVVGFIWATADKWITTGHQRDRAQLVEFTARLFEPAFAHQGTVAQDTTTGGTP